MWTPKQILKNQDTFHWWQIVLLLLFLNSLMIIPVSLHYAQMESYPIVNTFPNAFELIDNSVVNQLNQAKFQSGQMTLDEPFEMTSVHGTVRGGVTPSKAEEILSEEINAVLFLKDGFVLKESGQPASNVPYTKDVSFRNANTTEEVNAILSQQWFVKNQTFVASSFSFILYILLLAELILLSFGSALFIYITLKNKAGAKKTYQNAVSTILYAAGLPTLLAMVIGLLQFNIIIMITIQSVGMIGYVWVMYYQNRMNQLKEKKEQKAAERKAVQVHY